MKSRSISQTIFPCFGQSREIAGEENKQQEQPAGWTPLLFMVCIATTIGTAVPVGYFLGVMNTLSEFIKLWTQDSLYDRFEVDLSESSTNVLWAVMVSIFLAGGIFGSTFAAWFSNKFGRKGSMLTSAILLILSGFLLHFCRDVDSIEMLLAGRFLAGVAAALIYTTHPMYLLEIAPTELQGTVGVFCAVGVTVGIVIAQVLSLEQVYGNDDDWPLALSFFALIVIACFSPCYWFPESPRWLFQIKKNPELAAHELRRLRGSNTEERVRRELSAMEGNSGKDGKAEEITANSSYLSVLRDPELFLPLVIVCSFQFCQQLSGINAIFYYSMDIFRRAGFSYSNAAWMNLGAGCLNAIVSLLGPWLMSKYNRRPLMLISCFLCGSFLLATAFGLEYINLVDWFPIACIVFIAMFIVFFQFGLGPIPYFIGSELFEVAPRSVAMSIGSLCSWIGNLLIGMCFPILNGYIGAYAFLPCVVVCAYGFVLTLWYLPESRGRDATEIKPLMANGFKSRVRN